MRKPVSHGEQRDDHDGEHQRDHDLARKPVALRQRRGIAREPEERAVAERDEAGVADEDVEPHAGHGEDHDVGRGGQRQADRRASTNGSTMSAAAAIKSGAYSAHRAHSNFWMRSPNRPRGRNSSTSSISRYIDGFARRAGSRSRW